MIDRLMINWKVCWITLGVLWYQFFNYLQYFCFKEVFLPLKRWLELFSLVIHLILKKRVKGYFYKWIIKTNFSLPKFISIWLRYSCFTKFWKWCQHENCAGLNIINYFFHFLKLLFISSNWHNRLWILIWITPIEFLVVGQNFGKNILSFNQTGVSGFILRRNLLHLGSITSSLMLKCGKGWTSQRSETSPCRSWKTTPGLMFRDNNVSQIKDQLWIGRCSRSF